MKSFLITFLTLPLLLTSLRGQWEVINECYEFYLIDFVSEDVGWMVTEDTILKTSDGGETWIPDLWNFGEDYLGCEDVDVIDFVNDSVGWISMSTQSIDGSAGYGLFKTIDGGKTWEMCMEEKGLELVHVSDDKVIVSNNSGSKLLKSTDGGSTWEDISPAVHIWDPVSMSFIGSDTGIYVSMGGGSLGTEFNRTFDGGKTWDHRTLPEFDQITEIGFIDNLHGYFVARNNEFLTGRNSNHVICKTQDAFNTWTVVTENQYPIYSCHFFNEDVCIAIFEDSIGANIVKSSDGGRSWIQSESSRLPVNMFTSYDTYTINFSNEFAGYIYFSSHVLLKSIDQGDTWSMMNLSYPLTDVCFLNAKKGFAVGRDKFDFGDIFGTIDGGKSWNFVISKVSTPIDFDFVNDSIGFVDSWGNNKGSPDAYLYQSLDGGLSWNAYPHEFNQSTRIKFLSEQLGFAGNDSGIYITNNGGESWDKILTAEVTSLFTYPFTQSTCISTIAVSDANTFWALTGTNWGLHGEDCVIKFSKEGAWEFIDLETDLPLNKIFFKDENTGWITGGFIENGNPFEPILFKTENGGESWLKVENPYQFNDIYFKDMQYGWAVGGDSLHQGIILETTDGGKDWIVQVDSLSAPLNAVDYRDGFVWAVGGNGLILKKYDSNDTSGGENIYTYSEDEILVDLYPNPTSSFLNIKTVKFDQYAIRMYSINGQILFYKKIEGTAYQLDLSSFQKGIYFINIKSKDFATTKKIIKL